MSDNRRFLRLAWAIYRTSTITGLTVGVVAYGGYALLQGAPSALLISFPIILGFCLVAGIPATIIGVLVTALARWYRPNGSKSEWVGLGTVVGVAVVLGPLIPLSITVDALGSTGGRIFWSTFLVSAAIAGALAGLGAWRVVGNPSNEAA